uniref:Uncharacterized protein n=1 Tax=Plectus sambesii TaxID=2011161 RepID=A0A914V6F1_9BILA
MRPVLHNDGGGAYNAAYTARSKRRERRTPSATGAQQRDDGGGRSGGRHRATGQLQPSFRTDNELQRQLPFTTGSGRAAHPANALPTHHSTCGAEAALACAVGREGERWSPCVDATGIVGRPTRLVRMRDEFRFAGYARKFKDSVPAIVVAAAADRRQPDVADDAKSTAVGEIDARARAAITSLTKSSADGGPSRPKFARPPAPSRSLSRSFFVRPIDAFPLSAAPPIRRPHRSAAFRTRDETRRSPPTAIPLGVSSAPIRRCLDGAHARSSTRRYYESIMFVCWSPTHTQSSRRAPAPSIDVNPCATFTRGARPPTRPGRCQSLAPFEHNKPCTGPSRYQHPGDPEAGSSPRRREKQTRRLRKAARVQSSRADDEIFAHNKSPSPTMCFLSTRKRHCSVYTSTRPAPARDVARRAPPNASSDPGRQSPDPPAWPARRLADLFPGGPDDRENETNGVTLTLSCLNEESMRISLNTRLQEARFWKTLGIFFSATRFPPRGSVTDLKKCIVTAIRCADRKQKDAASDPPMMRH